MRLFARIAGVTYDITCRSESAAAELERFICGETEGAVPIIVTDEDVEYERAHGEAKGDTVCERFAILRKIAEDALTRDRMLIHGAVIEYRGRGYFFTAPSGTGKTTHIMLWKKHLGDEVTVINGDKPIIGLTPPITLYGTPWGGKEGYTSNLSVPLTAVIRLRQSKTNLLEPLSRSDALAALYAQCYLGKLTRAQTGVILSNLSRIVSAVPAFTLHCDMSGEAFKVSFDGLEGRFAK